MRKFAPIVTLLLWLTGCHRPLPTPVPRPTPAKTTLPVEAVTAARTSADAVGGTVGQVADDVERRAADPVMIPTGHVEGLKADVVSLRGVQEALSVNVVQPLVAAIGKLQANQAELDGLRAEVKGLQGDLAKEHEARLAAESSRDNRIRLILQLAAAACIAGGMVLIGLAFFTNLMESKTGIGLGLSLLAAGIGIGAFVTYMTYVLIGGGVLILCILGYAVWQAHKGNLADDYLVNAFKMIQEGNLQGAVAMLRAHPSAAGAWAKAKTMVESPSPAPSIAPPQG